MTTETSALLAASFLLGLLGTAHCSAMCGGIASALALRTPGWRAALVHHAGRLTAYLGLGLLAGAFGLLGADVPGLAWLPRTLRTLAVLVVLVTGLALLVGRAPWQGPARIGFALWQRTLGRLTASGQARSAFAAGLAWGLLPCGLSWTAASASLAAGPGAGLVSMLTFGLGTLPGVLPFSLAGAALARGLARPGVRRAAGLVLVLLAGVMAWTLWPGAAGHHHH